MPGTIQVSVLDLMDLPTPSSSLVSIKVAMGKKEFLTCDKGEFLFPLTTLRDNLIVTLHNAGGNEISRTDIQTMSVVEKGSWDDSFSLQGGGRVHMKLQFILNDDERKRIQDVRESVVKKKQEELVKRIHMNSEAAVNTTTDEECFKVPISDVVHQRKDSLSSSEFGEVIVTDQPDQVSPVCASQNANDLYSTDEISSGESNWCLLTAHGPILNDTDQSGNSSTGVLSQDIKEHPECSSEYFVQLTEANHDTPEGSLVIQVPHVSVSSKQNSMAEALDHQLENLESLPTNDITERTNLFSATVKRKILAERPLSSRVDQSGNSLISLLLQDLHENPECSAEYDFPLAEAKHNSPEESARMQVPPIDAFSEPNCATEPLDVQLGLSVYPSAKDINKKSDLFSITAQEKGTSSSETKILPEKTPSNVRKMISAFESSLTQRKSPHASLLTKSHLRKTEVEHSLKEQFIEQAYTEKTNKSQQVAKITSLYAKRSEETKHSTLETSGKAMEKDKELDSDNKNSFRKWNLGHQRSTGVEIINAAESQFWEGTNNGVEPIEASVGKFRRKQYSSGLDTVVSDAQTAYRASDRGLSSPKLEHLKLEAENNQIGEHRPRSRDQDYSVHRHVNLSGWTNHRDDLDRLNTHASIEKQKPAKYYKLDHCLFESLGSWMFQDDARHLCITTTSKKVRNLIDDCGIFNEAHPKEGDLCQQEEGEICSNSHMEVNQKDEAYCNLKKSNIESSKGASKMSRGFIEQVKLVDSVKWKYHRHREDLYWF